MSETPIMDCDRTLLRRITHPPDRVGATAHALEQVAAFREEVYRAGYDAAINEGMNSGVKPHPSSPLITAMRHADAASKPRRKRRGPLSGATPNGVFQ